jgi:hypothetical protein
VLVLISVMPQRWRVYLLFVVVSRFPLSLPKFICYLVDVHRPFVELVTTEAGRVGSDFGHAAVVANNCSCIHY